MGMVPRTTHISLLTDNWATATTVRTGTPLTGEYWKTISETRERLKLMCEMGFTVSVEWVPGHAGTTGNDRADEAARGAAEKSYGRPRDGDIHMPISIIKKFIKRVASEKRWWAFGHSSTATTPTASRATCMGQYAQIDGMLVRTRASRLIQVAITRLRAGYEVKPEDRMRTGEWETSDCPDCDYTYADARHRIFECPRWRVERLEVRAALTIALEHGGDVEFTWARFVALAGWKSRAEMEAAMPVWYGYLGRTGLALESVSVRKWANGIDSDSEDRRLGRRHQARLKPRDTVIELCPIDRCVCMC